MFGSKRRSVKFVPFHGTTHKTTGNVNHELFGWLTVVEKSPYKVAEPRVWIQKPSIRSGEKMATCSSIFVSIHVWLKRGKGDRSSVSRSSNFHFAFMKLRKLKRALTKKGGRNLKGPSPQLETKSKIWKGRRRSKHVAAQLGHYAVSRVRHTLDPESLVP